MSDGRLSVFLLVSLLALPAMSADRSCTPSAKERALSADLTCTWIARTDGSCSCRLVPSGNSSSWRNPQVVPIPIAPGTPGINNFPRAPGKQFGADEETTLPPSEGQGLKPRLLGQEKVQLLTPEEYRAVFPKFRRGSDGMTTLDDIAGELGKHSGGIVKDGAKVALPVNQVGR